MLQADRPVRRDADVLGFPGELQPALAAYEHAVRYDRRHAQAHYYAGLACAALGRREEACEHLEAYLSLEPKGRHARNAQARLSRLRAATAAAPPAIEEAPPPAVPAPEDIFIGSSELEFGEDAFEPGSSRDPRH